jgi:hypothetical protein
MHVVRRWIVCSLLIAGSLALAGPATAGHGTADKASNVEHLANVPPSNKETTNSDLAFWGELVYAGNYDGFRIIDASDSSNPEVLSDYFCPGAQGDVGVWDTGKQRLLFVSVDRRQNDIDPTVNGECSSPDPTRAIGWEGVRIFDVTDPRSPRFLTGVPTDCGSHTHTVVPDERRNRVLIYVSSYPLTEQGITQPDDEETDSECSPNHFKLSIVSVPFRSPESARVINEPNIAPANGCHDITAFIELKVAAGACLTEGQLYDISDPANPKVTHRMHNPLINFWHSASFTWDAKYLIFGDEEGGAAVTHGCNTATPPGAAWFHERSRPERPVGKFVQDRMQAPEGDVICTTHNYNIVPTIDGRYLFASAFYEAGTGVVDFDGVRGRSPGPPLLVGQAATEVGYFDAQDTDGAGEADTWSTYWYNGLLYANDIERGVDIFRPSGPATTPARTVDHLNPQTMEGRVRSSRRR